MNTSKKSSWPKLDGLLRLREVGGSDFRVPLLSWFSVDEWNQNRDVCVRETARLHAGKLVAIRSCAEEEDSLGSFVPGKYRSVLSVDSNDARDVSSAVNAVIDSYLRVDRNNADDLVLVQDFITDATYSGVCKAFGLSNYIEVEYVGREGLTDDVTAGRQAQRISISPHNSSESVWSSLVRAALFAVSELGGPVLIEFAIDTNRVCILQAKRISENPSRQSWAPSHIELYHEIEDSLPLSSMADWNPAEILGANPNYLDISLYQALITQEAWVEGRASLGWRRPQSIGNLLKVVYGKPYIRVASSMESLLPADLPGENLKEILCDRIRYLKLNPELHDKIEFFVVPSAPTLGRQEFIDRFHLERLDRSTANLYFDSLRSLVQNCFSSSNSWRLSDLAGIGSLRKTSQQLLNIDVKNINSNELRKLIGNAVTVCKKYGTIPFARQARLAFMYRQVLDYLHNDNQDTAEDLASWMLNIPSPASEMDVLFEAIRCGQTSAELVLQEYGHIRPFTYSIKSLRLDQDVQLFESILRGAQTTRPSNLGARRAPVIEGAQAYLESIGLNWPISRMLDECSSTFSARETLKFEFSRVTSAMLELIKNWAKVYEVSIEDLCTASLPELLNAIERCEDSKALNHLINDILTLRANHPRVSDQYFPEIAFTLTDFACVQETVPSPTFIGSSTTQGSVYVLDRTNLRPDMPMTGKMIVTEAADPGLDWIFTQGIAGLVTKHGGRFSHMAFRCAQAGVVAAIGCGEHLYRSAASAKNIELRPIEGRLVFSEQ